MAATKYYSQSDCVPRLGSKPVWVVATKYYEQSECAPRLAFHDCLSDCVPRLAFLNYRGGCD